jgi:GNAT superfamily N-acetyltransferase
VSDEPTVRPFTDDDLGPTLETLRAALGETPLLRRTPELFAWKHLDNPFGRSIMLVAVAGDVIAGFRAFMRWNLVTPGGELLHCVRAVDTATHPDFQRQGVFRSLTLAALDAARADGIDMVFNTPNPMSGGGYLSMGWREIGYIGAMVRPGMRMLHRSTSIPTLDEVFDRAVAAAGLEVDDRPARGLRTPRTAAYLRWRFGHPTARYARIDASGSTVVVRPNLRNGRVELVVADVFGPHATAAIRTAARSAQAGYLAGWFAAGSPERKAAMSAGMIPLPGVKTLRLVAHPFRPLPIDVTNLSSWDFATSDLELL